MKDEGVSNDDADITLKDDVSPRSALVAAGEKRQLDDDLKEGSTLKKRKGANGTALAAETVAETPPAAKATAARVVEANAPETGSDPTATNEGASAETNSNHAVEATQAYPDTGRRRSRRSSAQIPNASIEPPKPRAKRVKKKVSDDEEEFKMAWICCECKEAECMMHPDADQLLICEGACRRLFHYPCAGLAKPPAKEESYVCQDCQKGRHVCAFCQSYGVDNEDVFRCCIDKCGLFFHEACLEMNNVEVKLIGADSNTTDGENEAKASGAALKRLFKCPAHACATCFQKDMIEKEKKAVAESRKDDKKRGRKKAKIVQNANFGYKTGQDLIVSFVGCSSPDMEIFLTFSYCIIEVSRVSQLIPHYLHSTHGSFQRTISCLSRACCKQ